LHVTAKLPVFGLGKDTSVKRSVQPKPAKGGKLIELPRLGGLHRRYEWRKTAQENKPAVALPLSLEILKFRHFCETAMFFTHQILVQPT
jgi:hypothetical protein